MEIGIMMSSRANGKNPPGQSILGLRYKLSHIPYKWIALANTTLGLFIAALDGSIVLISLPAIFTGIGINPLAPAEIDYLLWTLMGYLAATAMLLVAFGRISDMFGRVRLYNLGFAIFAVGSILLYLVHVTGNTAALQIIIFRLVQAVGGAFLFANSSAILTDAFQPNQRGTAMGINQIAFLAGQFIGLIVGSVLAAINWPLVFLVSVPFSVGGTIWAYIALHEIATIRRRQKLDIPGNLLFALGLTALLLGMTYGLQPYQNSTMGWGNPIVIDCLAGGIIALIAFIFIKKHVSEPMFRVYERVDGIVNIITHHLMRNDKLLTTLEKWTPGLVDMVLEKLSSSRQAQVVDHQEVCLWSASIASYDLQQGATLEYDKRLLYR
jgi:MFS family permease